MFFLEYGLNILVDNNQLLEFSEPVKDCKEYVTTKPSYVRSYDTGKEIYSIKNWFVSVPETGLHFSIRIWSIAATRQNPILAVIFIDGISDYILHLLDSDFKKIIDTFTDKDNKKSYILKFNPTLWIENESDMRNTLNDLSKSCTKFGGMGCVSVYFYKAVRGFKSPQVPDYTLQQVPLNEKKGPLHGINLSTTFVEKPDSLLTGQIHTKPYIGWKPDGKALAVLHLHYRPSYWLKLNEIIPESLFSHQNLNWNSSESQISPDQICAESSKSDQATGSNAKTEIITIDDGDDVEIKVENVDENFTSSESPIKRKCCRELVDTNGIVDLSNKKSRKFVAIKREKNI